MKLILSDDEGTVIDMWTLDTDNDYDIGVFEVLAGFLYGGPTPERIREEIAKINKED